MPGQTTTALTLVKQGAFDADLMNALNSNISTNVANLASQSPGIVGTAVNSAAVPFGNYTTAGTIVNLVAAGAAAGTYRVTVYAVITTLFTGATTVTHTIGWTDDNKAQTASGGTLGALTAGTNGSATVVLRSTGAAAITLTEAATGANATAGAMGLSVFVERLV